MLCPSVVWILKPKRLPHWVHLGWILLVDLSRKKKDGVGAPMTNISNNWWYVWVQHIKEKVHAIQINSTLLIEIDWMKFSWNLKMHEANANEQLILAIAENKSRLADFPLRLDFFTRFLPSLRMCSGSLTKRDFDCHISWSYWVLNLPGHMQVTSARFFATKDFTALHIPGFLSHKAAQLLFPWPAWPGRCVDDSCPSSTRPWPPKPPRPPSCRAKPRKRAWCFSSSEVSSIPQVNDVRLIL